MNVATSASMVRLQHPAGSFVDEFIKWASAFEVLAKGDHLGIEFFVCWQGRLVCCNLAHGVSLCPRWAAEVCLTSAGYAAFFQSLKNTTSNNTSRPVFSRPLYIEETGSPLEVETRFTAGNADRLLRHCLVEWNVF